MVRSQIFNHRVDVSEETAVQEKTLDRQSSNVWAAVIMLTLVTLLTFANALHETLVFDDKAFVGPERHARLDHLGDAFRSELWGKEGVSGLYRPLLLINFELEDRLFGGWARGFHLANILLHLAATLLLFGFLRHMLLRSPVDRETAGLAALLAALVFAVHPVHAEAVNSVFNRSSIYVSLFAVAGLWWLFVHLDTRPARAWFGLGIAYTFGILFKESALVIPGLAVALIVTLTPGGGQDRLRRFLPVFWLLIPLGFYFYLRSSALIPVGTEPFGSELDGMLEATRLPGLETLLSAIGVLGGSLKMLLWPYPLQLYYPYPSVTLIIASIIGLSALAIAAVTMFLKGRPGLVAGLAFFIIAMLPASRLIGIDGAPPHLADRYLYYPSIGLALALAFVFMAILKQVPPKVVIVFALPLLLLLAALTWERNYDWSSELLLFETDYARGIRTDATIRILVSSHQDQGHAARVAEICEENSEIQDALGLFANTCGLNYLRLNRTEDAIRSFERSALLDETWLEANLAIGGILIDQGNLQEGANRFLYVINRIEDPAYKELYRGVMLVRLYPRNRQRLLEARGYFEKALELKPELQEAKTWIDHLNTMLNPRTGNRRVREPAEISTDNSKQP
jgi:tetratricopeptide (TPR) repeat protein